MIMKSYSLRSKGNPPLPADVDLTDRQTTHPTKQQIYATNLPAHEVVLTSPNVTKSLILEGVEGASLTPTTEIASFLPGNLRPGANLDIAIQTSAKGLVGIDPDSTFLATITAGLSLAGTQTTEMTSVTLTLNPYHPWIAENSIHQIHWQ